VLAILRNVRKRTLPSGTQVAVHRGFMKTSSLIFACLVGLSVPASSEAAAIRVPADAGTIQQAIDTAATGDTVLVAPGTYVETITFRGKAITVASEQGPEVTIIDGNRAGSVVTFASGETRGAVLQGSPSATARTASAAAACAFRTPLRASSGTGSSAMAHVPAPGSTAPSVRH
jgi:hypothetical protein